MKKITEFQEAIAAFKEKRTYMPGYTHYHWHVNTLIYNDLALCYGNTYADATQVMAIDIHGHWYINLSADITTQQLNQVMKALDIPLHWSRDTYRAFYTVKTPWGKQSGTIDMRIWSLLSRFLVPSL